MLKTFTEEQVEKLLAKEAAKTEKEVAKAVKAENTRVLNIIKEAGVANKEVESKEVKTHVTNVLKEITASIKEAA